MRGGRHERTAARAGPAPPRGLHRFARGVHLSWVTVGASSSVVARNVTAGASLVQGPKVPPLRGRARAAPSALSVGSVGTPALEVRARPSVWARQRAFPRACMDQACRGLVPPCLTRRPPTTTIIPPGVLSVVTDSPDQLWQRVQDMLVRRDDRRRRRASCQTRWHEALHA